MTARRLEKQMYRGGNKGAALQATLSLNFAKPTVTQISPSLPGTHNSYKYLTTLRPLLFSPALFAFWLRSSVVSVLFSLISEIILRNESMIILIFVPCRRASVLAYAHRHSVIGLTLPPIDANIFFHHSLQLVSGVLEKKSFSSVEQLPRAEQDWLQQGLFANWFRT